MDIRSQCHGKLITFDILPDDILVEIFDFYLEGDEDENMDEFFERIPEWITLAHVCGRWRSVIFQSPRRLNLRILCTCKTPAKDVSNIWPPFPLTILEDSGFYDDDTASEDNVIAALEHNNRVCHIDIRHLTNSDLGTFTDSAPMQRPFPELTDLCLCVLADNGSQILPESFLGGAAPRLRSLELDGVPFPGLSALLLSTTHLDNLSLLDIHRSGYIPPEVMATSLSALTSLRLLFIRFRHPRIHPALESLRPPPPPLTRSILPSLVNFKFIGASEYLEVILARIDAPQIDGLEITLFNQIIFDTLRLFQFVSRRLRLNTTENVHFILNPGIIFVGFRSQTDHYGVLVVQIPCSTSEWDLSSIDHWEVCTSSLPSISKWEDLYIFESRPRQPPCCEDDIEIIEDTLWLDLLRSFVAVKNLYISEEFVPHIAPTLQELAEERTTEVLPTLENIFLEGFQSSGPLHEDIEMFVAARRLTSRRVAVSRWEL